MIIELAEKRIIQILKDNLEILRKSEDENVKQVIADLEKALLEYDEANEELSEDKDEDDKKDIVAEIKETTDVVEDKQPEVKQEITPEIKKEESVNIADVQLSMQVANKLKEAALELDKKEKDIENISMELQAKNDIIDGYKNKFIELNKSIELKNKELSAYKQKEQLELKKNKENIIKDLLELYSNLSMSKTHDELELFGLSQLLELRKALEVTIEKKNTPVRQTVNSSTIKTVKQPQKEPTSAATFEGLFGKNPDYY